jgi:RNA polymerase sigma-70 factor (ECF subfamily)
LASEKFFSRKRTNPLSRLYILQRRRLRLVDQWIALYGRRLYGLCLSLCRNRADADDLYQETWLKVLKSKDKFDASRPFEPWLARICANAYRNILRRLKRSPIFNSFPSSEAKDAAINQAPAAADGDFSDLHEAINRLPEKMRVSVLLYYFSGFDVKEAAKALGVKEGTVKSRLSKARAILREVLGSAADL